VSGEPAGDPTPRALFCDSPARSGIPARISTRKVFPPGSSRRPRARTFAARRASSSSIVVRGVCVALALAVALADTAQHALVGGVAATAIAGAQGWMLWAVNYGLVFAATGVCFPIAASTATIVIGGGAAAAGASVALSYVLKRAAAQPRLAVPVTANNIPKEAVPAPIIVKEDIQPPSPTCVVCMEALPQ